jgi:hypothetical protein
LEIQNADHRDHESIGSSTVSLCPISRPKGKVDLERCASHRDDPRNQGGQIQHSDAVDGDGSESDRINKERLIKSLPRKPSPPARAGLTKRPGISSEKILANDW